MTEEFWQSYKKKKDLTQTNTLFKGIADGIRQEQIRDKHPDELYAICRTDNNYWRHYRASPKLTIDELSMMICKEVGCDLSYCQNLMWKPKTPNQNISDCSDQYNSFRECVVREKKIFRSIVGSIDTKANPMAIPDYLEKHFKEKEALKRKKQMMGGDEDELKAKIRKVEEDSHILRAKVIDTQQFQKQKQQIVMGQKEEEYI
eukprot:403341025